MIAPEELPAAGDWLVSGFTGSSSKWMLATALSGRIPVYSDPPAYPRDEPDLGRCIRLIEKVPSVREAAFPILAEACPKWKALIDDWDALTALYKAVLREPDTRYRAESGRMQELFGAIPR